MEIRHNSDRENNSVIKYYSGMSMNQLRHLQVSRLINTNDILSLIDFGCSQGLLLQKLGRSQTIRLVIGVDIDEAALSSATFNTFPQGIQQDIQYQRNQDQHLYVYRGDVTKKYPLLKEKEVQLVTLVQLIEHLLPEQIQPALDNIFGFLRPKFCFISTPNQEFNAHFEFLEGQMRHWDHKFEWTRAQFKNFCDKIENQFGYTYTIGGIGEHIIDESKGFCTQFSIFTRKQNPYTQSILNFETNSQLQQKAHYTNFSWRSNRGNLERGLLYKSLYGLKDITLEESVQFIKLQPFGVCMIKQGETINKQTVFRFLQRNEEIFFWNNQRYSLKRNNQSKQEQVQQQNQFCFEFFSCEQNQQKKYLSDEHLQEQQPYSQRQNDICFEDFSGFEEEISISESYVRPECKEQIKD